MIRWEMAEKSALPWVGAVSGVGAVLFTIIAALGIDIPTLNRLASTVPKLEIRVEALETKASTAFISMAARADHPDQLAELRSRVRELERLTQANAERIKSADDALGFLVPQYMSHSHPMSNQQGAPRTASPHPQ